MKYYFQNSKGKFNRPNLILPFLFFAVISIIMLSAHVSKIIPAIASAGKLQVLNLKVKPLAINFEALTDLAFPESGEIWVAEQGGKIWIIKNGKRLANPLLDISGLINKLNKGYEERGLLAITLHPEFKVNGKFYLFYTSPSKQKFNHTSVISEYVYSQNKVDPFKGRIILEAEHPDGNHNGGCLRFGNDGYLYVSIGDGGGQHDQHGTIGNGQDLNTLLGKILRIDVNVSQGYNVPSDNPFVGHEGKRREIWAYGFRNPYRFSFDKISGECFVGEVGQDLWEEINLLKKGANYGWRIVEGMHCHNVENKPDTTCDVKGITMPIHEYSHKVGISVTGGYMYNGKSIPALKRKYFFADWTGPIFYLQKIGKSWERGDINLSNLPENLKITGINEDNAGELYLLTNPDTGPSNSNCGIYQVIAAK